MALNVALPLSGLLPESMCDRYALLSPIPKDFEENLELLVTPYESSESGIGSSNDNKVYDVIGATNAIWSKNKCPSFCHLGPKVLIWGWRTVIDNLIGFIDIIPSIVTGTWNQIESNFWFENKVWRPWRTWSR